MSLPTPDTPPHAPPAAAPIALCPSEALVERSRAHLFDLQEYGRPALGFVLRHDGQVVAYLNRCAHVPTEMDWQPGEFLSHDRRWIICSIHGALYEPASGLCVQGPCTGRRLRPLQVEERDGQVYWYPTPPFEPLSPADTPVSPT